MNKAELEQHLRDAGIWEGAYFLHGRPSEGYCIEHRDGRWYACYIERSQLAWERSFATESEACTFFLQELLDDHGARKPH